MALSNVTRDAIVETLREYRDLRADGFHAKWGGSDRNVDYWIYWEGDFYPSKTIVNVAHYKLMGDATLSKHSQYSGGLSTIVPVLERYGFEFTEGKVDWDREEMMLALNLYLHHPQPPKGSPAIVEVSELLRQRARQIGRLLPPRFRNPDGVYLKMMNFRRFDPEQLAKGNVGMVRGAHLEEQVWAEWAKQPKELAAAAGAIATSIRANLPVGEAFMDDPDTELGAEGGYNYRKHRRYERNPSNARKKKAAVRKAGHPLVCEACQFDFESAFGARGADYIEVHHRKPVSTIEPGTVPKMEDLALLCSNCHRMAHRWGKLMSVEDLATLRQAHQSSVA